MIIGAIMIFIPLEPIVKGSPGPESHQHDKLGNENENVPEVINLEGPRPGLLDPGSGVEDSLSDPNDSPNDNKIVDTSELKRFSFVLQGAQCWVVQLEHEKAKVKRKMLKTYLGKFKSNYHLP